MKDNKFTPPRRKKHTYITINSLIIISIVLIGILSQKATFLAIPLAALFLFNGLWSVNRNWYSLIHRGDNSNSVKYAWIIFIFLGALQAILLTLYFVF